MEGKYQAYPEYKDSGVEWLGDVPEHWEVKKLKYIANIFPSNVDKKTKREEVPVQLCNYTDVYYNDVIKASDNFMNASATEEQVKKFTLLAGDIIITKDSEDAKDIAIPAFVPKDVDGVVCAYHLALVRPYEKKYGALIKRNFEATYVRAYMGTRANGLTRYGLGTYALSNSFFVQPPQQEASAIANFLDHETAKIDTLIEKQKQLIALLKEKRQAVISHAVTKGLNPDAPKKDSGVEWLGEVPEHWETGSLRWYIKIASGEGLSNTNFEQSKDDNCMYPVVGGNGVFGFSPYFNTSTQALAIGRVGALCGNVHLINEKCWITDNALKLSYWRAFYSKFLHLLIYAARLNEFASTTAQPLITGEQVKALHVVIPPIPEQQQIGNFVDHETSKIDTLIEKQQKAIAL